MSWMYFTPPVIQGNDGVLHRNLQADGSDGFDLLQLVLYSRHQVNDSFESVAHVLKRDCCVFLFSSF